MCIVLCVKCLVRDVLVARCFVGRFVGWLLTVVSRFFLTRCFLFVCVCVGLAQTKREMLTFLRRASKQKKVRLVFAENHVVLCDFAIVNFVGIAISCVLSFYYLDWTQVARVVDGVDLLSGATMLRVATKLGTCVTFSVEPTGVADPVQVIEVVALVVCYRIVGNRQ